MLKEEANHFPAGGGPRGSVYEPPALPPDYVAALKDHCSSIGRSLLSV